MLKEYLICNSASSFQNKELLPAPALPPLYPSTLHMLLEQLHCSESTVWKESYGSPAQIHWSPPATPFDTEPHGTTLTTETEGGQKAARDSSFPCSPPLVPALNNFIFWWN